MLAHKMLPMFRQLHSPLAEQLPFLERTGGKDVEKTQYVINRARELLHIIKLHFVV